ncbi:hypothetical protein [Bartonella sp. MF74HXZ]
MSEDCGERIGWAKSFVRLQTSVYRAAWGGEPFLWLCFVMT